jgi:hypothetical protein
MRNNGTVKRDDKKQEWLKRKKTFCRKLKMEKNEKMSRGRGRKKIKE